MKSISQTEKLVLLGLVTYPHLPDNEISAKLSLPNSTFASAKSRIQDMGYLEEIIIPIFPRLGLELLATVYSDFNPSVKVEDRVRFTSRAIEVYPELILSLGESHRGFSISIAPNITRIMTISNERNKLFAEKGLIETKLPWEVMFPFKLSRIHRFFNLAPLLLSKFTREGVGLDKVLRDVGFDRSEVYKNDLILQMDSLPSVFSTGSVDLTRTQQEVLYYVVRYPWMSSSKLASVAPFSRHTISRTKERLIEDGYISKLRIPDLSMLGYNILSLFHAQIDLKKPLPPESLGRVELLQDDTMFFVSRPREMLMLAAYEDYKHYNRGMSSFNHFLKSNDHLFNIPNVRNHSLSDTIWIKKFQFHPLINSIFNLNL
ncbi:MAG: hypothetical protein ACMUIG_01690 [Thermoplasmatota archaeon]